MGLLEILGTAGLFVSFLAALIGLVTSLIGWRRSSKVDHSSPVLEQMQRDKAEMLGHVTANRVQAQRHTDKVARDLKMDMEVGHTILLGMIADIDARIPPKRTKRANSKTTFASADTVSAETIERIPHAVR
jgi:hypothetical protein